MTAGIEGTTAGMTDGIVEMATTVTTTGTNRKGSVTDWIVGRKMLGGAGRSIRTIPATSGMAILPIARDSAEGIRKDTASMLILADGNRYGAELKW